MSSKNSSDEIGFHQLLNNMKSMHHSLLRGAFNVYSFFIKRIIIFIVLIVIGAVAGFFLTKDSQPYQKTTLLVQLNYNSANYVYSTIKQLNNELVQYDQSFLKSNNLFQKGQPVIYSIEISPIVSLSEIMRKLPDNNRNLDYLLQQAQYKDQLLTSEIFVPEYKTHKITITAPADADTGVIQKTLAYINSNELLQQLAPIYKNSLQTQIEESKYSIAQIDSILSNFGKDASQKASISSNKLYINTSDKNIDNLYLVLKEKTTLLQQLEIMQTDLIKSTQPVVLLNEPTFKIKKGLFYNKTIWLPILFIVLYISYCLLKKAIKKGRYLHELNNEQ